MTASQPSIAQAERRAGPSSWLVYAVVVPAITSGAGLATIAASGPTSIHSLTIPWVVTYSAILATLVGWWAAYAWLHARLARAPRQGIDWLIWPALALMVSILPDAAVILSGRFSYVLVFDEETFRLFRYLAAATIGAAVLAQEAALILAAREKNLLTAPVESPPRPRAAAPAISETYATRVLPAIGLTAVIALGIKLRFDALDSFHGGDMDVMLSLTYNLLGWPPVHYYHSYVSQAWVYNHFPFFPIVLAPFYWLFENVLHLPTPWAAKLLIGAADVAIAVLLYRTAGRRRHSWLGMAAAGLWMLAPWVIGGDDHPISFAILFGLLALASLDRPSLCGLALALGIASRNEVAFLALPVVVHFVARRPLAQSATFEGTFGTVLAVIVLPFALFDPGAMVYALVGQLQRDASTVQSMLFLALAPHLPPAATNFLRYNPSLPAMAAAGLISLAALREGRVERVVLLVALVYLVTLPLLYERYFLFLLVLALYYAVRYSNPIVAVAGALVAWPEFPYAPQLLLATALVLGAAILLRPVAPAAEPEVGAA
ncbi:MAG TPA: hypothetical protein VF960_05725 [Chloroflexota bacterium]